jgi:Eco57I restriction-modification methylase
MVTATTLAGLRRMEDLPELALALGQEAAWEELPVPGWLDLSADRSPVARAAVVGRAGEFIWFGTEAAEAGKAARALARRLVARGGVGGILALAPAERRLALAIGFGDVPWLDCSLDDPDRLTLTRLGRIGVVPFGGALAFAARAADAVGAEAVGQRFFGRFRATLEAMSSALPRVCPATERHRLALLQLTRVLFLYFVQSKGWLDGRPDFLARHVDACLGRGRRLERDLLRPLFFGTLNRPAEHRSRLARTFGGIPFLNGGLFEPHPLERRWPAHVPNDVWRDAFDTLFERFSFTADEAGRPGLIAPDMLGRVFEGVMEPDLRHRSGTFYTPAALVRSLVHAGLVALLSERLDCPESRAARYLADRAAPARRVLKDVRLLDPAVGSGAFLLGALEQLAEVQAGDRPSAPARRRVLRRSLFGVDLNAAAVRLTELRLWLAVIADERAGAAGVEPLPNLDCLVRQGDSLLDPAGRWPGGRSASRAEAAALGQLRQRLVVSTGAEKRALARELRRAEGRAFAGALAAAEDALERAIAQCLADARAPTLFGEPRGLDRTIRSQLARLKTERRTVRAAWRRFRRDGDLPWFHYESQFADVFERGGFDVVVGNPPWVRAEEIPRELREQLGVRFRWWRVGKRPGFTNLPNLALAFVERAWELARPGGAVAMLVPAKLATAGYAARARHALAAEGTIRAAADLTGAPEAAFDATVYPMALIATKRPAPESHRVRTNLRVSRSPAAAGVAQSELAGGGPWTLAAPAVLAALRALAEHSRLEERFTCHLGVKTGANDVFLDPPEGVEPDLIRWAIRGRDVRAFRAERVRRLLWPCTPCGRPLPELPPGAGAYLAPHAARLRTRADHGGGPSWALFRTVAASAPFRVVWADLARRLTAVALVDDRAREQIPLNTCYVVAAPDSDTALRLAAWLNTTWLRAAARILAPPAAGGFGRFSARIVGGLPLGDAALADPALGELARAGADGLDVQREIDALAARHLGLDAAATRALATAQPDHPR